MNTPGFLLDCNLGVCILKLGISSTILFMSVGLSRSSSASSSFIDFFCFTSRGFFRGSLISGTGTAAGGGSVSSPPKLGKLDLDRTSARLSISAMSVKLRDFIVDASEFCAINLGGSASSRRRSSIGRSAAGGSGRRQGRCGTLAPILHDGRNDLRPANRCSALLTNE